MVSKEGLQNRRRPGRLPAAQYLTLSQLPCSRVGPGMGGRHMVTTTLRPKHRPQVVVVRICCSCAFLQRQAFILPFSSRSVYSALQISGLGLQVSDAATGGRRARPAGNASLRPNLLLGVSNLLRESAWINRGAQDGSENASGTISLMWSKDCRCAVGALCYGEDPGVDRWCRTDWPCSGP